ncbi:MAG: hypothetical protein M3461_00605 [Pseudomonadota bacterium]|nr:hypothetical protein [Pseudomonadota bacterium]
MRKAAFLAIPEGFFTNGSLVGRQRSKVHGILSSAVDCEPIFRGLTPGAREQLEVPGQDTGVVAGRYRGVRLLPVTAGARLIRALPLPGHERKHLELA